jgi:hypothetical protein
MEYILAHLEKLKAETPSSEPRLWECVNNSWMKMRKYYELIDKSHQIYAAATFLNPTERLDFFDANWIGELKPWIPIMEGHCRELWELEYSYLARKEDSTKPTDAFEAWRNRTRKLEQLYGDEFSQYCPKGAGSATVSSKAVNPIDWWDLLGQHLPSIRQWAFDTLACPATSCECERAFSSAKRLITPDRNSLGDELIEALECLKAWWDNGLVQRH